MVKMEITQASFDMLINNLNHKMTKIEGDVRWLKRITGWQVAMITGIFISILTMIIIR